MQNITLTILAGTGLGAAIAMSAGMAQEAPRPAGILKSQSQLDAELERSTPELGIVAGQVTEIIANDEGRIVVRRRLEGPNNASVHEDLTEVYQIVSGAGTFVTGGTIVSPEDRTAGLSGGVAQRVSEGDFIILPPGTPHWFSQIEGSITYVETRFATGR